MNQLRLITPVYNDWTSFAMLLRELDKVAASLPLQIFVSAIDDGSEEAVSLVAGQLAGLQHIVGAEVVSLAVNVGHQRAIAIGLCAAAQDHDFDAVLIMDADGEAPPTRLRNSSRAQRSAKTSASSLNEPSGWRRPPSNCSICSTKGSSS